MSISSISATPSSSQSDGVQASASQRSGKSNHKRPEDLGIQQDGTQTQSGKASQASREQQVQDIVASKSAGHSSSKTGLNVVA
jgi:hypothetical protein